MEQEQYRERSRSPSNDGYNRDRRHNHEANHEENLSENFTLYITNLQFEVTTFPSFHSVQLHSDVFSQSFSNFLFSLKF
jgi:hypothetical protein